MPPNSRSSFWKSLLARALSSRSVFNSFFLSFPFHLSRWYFHYLRVKYLKFHCSYVKTRRLYLSFLFRGLHTMFHAERFVVALIADHNEWPVHNNSSLSFWTRRYDITGYRLLFVLPIFFYLNIHKTEKLLQFWDKKFLTSVARHFSTKGAVINATFLAISFFCIN